MAKEKLQPVPDTTPGANLLDHVEVEVEAVLGNTAMTVAELNALTDGDVIQLDKQINEPVSVRVNGRVIGYGEIVTVNDCFAVRLTQIGG